MVFATPRSWDRVSQILKMDADVTKPVIRNKIIGNVGETEGRQFVEYCRTYHNLVSAEDFLNGARAPSAPEELSILTESLAARLSFLKGKNQDTLSDAQKSEASRVIRAMFRLPKAEYTVVGLKRAMEYNREAVKTLFLRMDDAGIARFIRANSYALGLTDEDLSDQKPSKKRGLFR